MPEEYTKEQVWKLYEKLSQELKEAIFSEETADNIWNICTKNGVDDDRISEVARYAGRVLMGLLPPDNLGETLEKELKLDKDVAKKIGQEINRFIFYPVKTRLEELYKIEIAPVAKPKIRPVSEKKLREEAERPKREDVYREPIE